MYIGKQHKPVVLGKRRAVDQWGVLCFLCSLVLQHATPSTGGCVYMKLYEATKEFLLWRKRQNHASPTVIQNESNLRQFAIFARNPEITAVDEAMVLEYLALLEDELETKNNSLIPKVNALRQFFKYWNERAIGVLSYHRIPLPRKDFTMPQIPTNEEFEKFWHVVTNPKNNYYQHIRNAAMIGVISATGIRNGECCSLELKNVSCDKPVVTANGNMYRAIVKTEKSRGMRPFREIFWNEEINEIVKKWMERRARLHEKHQFLNPELLFVGLNSRLADTKWGGRLTPNAIDEIFRRYSRMASVKVRPHDYRHKLGIDMAEEDASDHVISEVLGHSQLQSSRQYTKLHGTRRAEQFARFRPDNRSATT